MSQSKTEDSLESSADERTSPTGQETELKASGPRHPNSSGDETTGTTGPKKDEPAWPDLVDGEEVITNKIWYRQCPTTPTHWDAEAQFPTALIFQWKDNEQGRQMSGSCPPKGTPENSYRHRVENEGRGSHGTWAVPFATVESLGLRLVNDSANLPKPPESPPGHTYLDMRLAPTGKSAQARAARESVRSRLLVGSYQAYKPSKP